ncbi:hypothetical protein PZH32_03100 [Adlercreutzia equolifaciens]|uniref:hypothetical protein n=1 Tax=Adlercreutzia equolifaciens TaxID=446660 RepID=UPI0023B1A698|nr:hypothetical protein [Adlercreutzia equolifaciens]MDE8701944.1 hypothetical protein [Adlercreutzia equolifaciens]
MQTIKSIEQSAGAEEPAASAFATWPEPDARQQAKYRRPISNSIKAAACIAAAIGIIFFAFLPLPYQLAPETKAVANAPVLPHQRIQLKVEYQNRYIVDGKEFTSIPVKLNLPVEPAQNLTLVFRNTGSVLFTANEPVTEHDAQADTTIPLDTQGSVSLFATVCTDLTSTEEDLSAVPDGWTWNPTAAMQIIEKLRWCEIAVVSQGKTIGVYTVDFKDYPTVQEVIDQLDTVFGFPYVCFPLTRQE